jgi:hypothetical protein
VALRCGGTWTPGGNALRAPSNLQPVQAPGCAVVKRWRIRPYRRLHAAGEEHVAYLPSGTSQITPSGGSVIDAEHGWPCQGTASASTPPRLPTFEPP